MTCSACGAVLVESARFCSSCGASTTPEGPAKPTYTPRHLTTEVLTSRFALEGERKQVTVLFADLVDSTALAEKVGADGMHVVVDALFERSLAIVHRFAGTINQFLGDGFMALFGAPVAHEDHARRAVAAALDIQRELADLELVVAGHRIDGLPLRIGLNTGVVVVGAIGDNLRMDYTAVGDTTHLAARVMAAAEAPVVNVHVLSAELSIRPQNVYRALEPLVEAEVLVASGGRRDRLWRVPKVLAALDAFARRARRGRR